MVETRYSCPILNIVMFGLITIFNEPRMMKLKFLNWLSCPEHTLNRKFFFCAIFIEIYVLNHAFN